MKEMKKVLFPIDLSESSKKVVPYVRSLVEAFGARLYLVHVVGELRDFPEFYLPRISVADFEEEIAKGAEERMQGFVDEHLAGIGDIDLRVIIGDIVEAILRLVEAEGIDLVVMGTHGRKGLDKVMFGSVAERVVRLAPCPVVTVNPHRV